MAKSWRGSVGIIPICHGMARSYGKHNSMRAATLAKSKRLLAAKMNRYSNRNGLPRANCILYPTAAIGGIYTDIAMDKSKHCIRKMQNSAKHNGYSACP